MEIKYSLLFFGMFSAILATSCSQLTFENPRDRTFLDIPIGIIGFIGYAVMAIALNIGLSLYYVLVLSSFLITILLIIKSAQLRKVCMFCAVCWLINIGLAIDTYITLAK